MKQNGVVCEPGPLHLFFIFRFEYLISGPKSYRDVRETGPWSGRPVLTFGKRPISFEHYDSRATKKKTLNYRHTQGEKKQRDPIFLLQFLNVLYMADICGKFEENLDRTSFSKESLIK